MKLYSKQEAIARMNMLAGCSKSFVFLIDYSQEQVYVEETAEVSPEELIYNLNGFTNEAVAGLTDELLPESLPEQIEWISQSVSFQEYSRAFGHVKKNILAGNTRKKTIPPATKCSLRQSLLWRHYSYYQILSLVCLRNLNHSITPALVSPNGKAIQTPVSPQPKTKPQRYPTGKDIIK